MENEGPIGPAIGQQRPNAYESDRQSMNRKIPDPPNIEFDPDPEELERINRAMSRQLSVKQLAQLSLRHSVARRGRSRSGRAQSDFPRPTVQEQQPQTPAQADDRPQEQRLSRIPDGRPPQLKFTPLELTRGGPSHSHKLSVIREAKAAAEERLKRAHELSVRRSMRAQNGESVSKFTTASGSESRPTRRTI